MFVNFLDLDVSHGFPQRGGGGYKRKLFREKYKNVEVQKEENVKEKWEETTDEKKMKLK